MREISETLISEIVEDLQGTCKSLDNILEWHGLTLEDFSEEQEDELNQAIDNSIFLCEGCGWWCEQGDYAEDSVNTQGLELCSDCGEE